MKKVGAAVQSTLFCLQIKVIFFWLRRKNMIVCEALCRAITSNLLEQTMIMKMSSSSLSTLFGFLLLSSVVSIILLFNYERRSAGECVIIADR